MFARGPVRPELPDKCNRLNLEFLTPARQEAKDTCEPRLLCGSPYVNLKHQTGACERRNSIRSPYSFAARGVDVQ